MPKRSCHRVRSCIASATDQASLASIRILLLGPDRRSHGFHHPFLGGRIDPDLQVEAGVAPLDTVAALLGDALHIARGQVVEVVDFVTLKPAEELVERAAAVLSAEIPQRHVDTGERKIAGLDAIVPQAAPVDVLARCRSRPSSCGR